MIRMPTVVNMFAGIHGCTLGFKRAGFRSLAAIDFDAKACEQGRRLTGSPTYCRNLALMQPEDLRELVPVAPDVLVMSPPCKSFSGCMPAARAGEAHYVDMSQLAVRATFLALEAWAAPPGLILIENVPRIQTRGAPLLAQIVALLQHSGYATDQGTHDCGVIGGLAQHRERFLLAARHMERVPSFLRKPPAKRVRNVGEVLLPLPSPAADHGDHMHRLPLLSALNWLRLAAIRAGKDWRDLPAEIRIAGERETADPRVPWDMSSHGGRPDSYGVGTMEAPSLTVRSKSLVQTSRASIADPRLGCKPRTGACGVQATDQPGATVVGHHAHDNSPGSVADPRLAHAPRRGTMGVMAEDEPAPTVRAHHEVRQAPGAVVDSRGWPVPTHELVIEDGAMVLYGPPLDLASKRSCYLVIRAPDGTWHRPLTDRELATLQGFPTDFQIEGPRSSSKTQAGVREWIGNAIPVDAAEAIGLEAAATLRSSSVGGFLRGHDVWVEQAESAVGGST